METDYESTVESEGSDGGYGGSDSDTDSFSTIQGNLEHLSAVIKELCDETERMEGELLELQRPIENLTIEQFGDAPFMAGSAFRAERFSLRPPGIPGADLGRRYTFAEICQVLRTYLLESGACSVAAGTGIIHLNDHLKRLFEVQESEMSYVQLLGRLRKVLI